MHNNIVTEMFIGQFLIHWMHMRAYWLKIYFRNNVDDNAWGTRVAYDLSVYLVTLDYL